MKRFFGDYFKRFFYDAIFYSADAVENEANPKLEPFFQKQTIFYLGDAVENEPKPK